MCRCAQMGKYAQVCRDVNVQMGWRRSVAGSYAMVSAHLHISERKQASH